MYGSASNNTPYYTHTSLYVVRRVHPPGETPTNILTNGRKHGQVYNSITMQMFTWK